MGSPACAGMSPWDHGRRRRRAGFPRLRGDVPLGSWTAPPSGWVPPLARGCPLMERRVAQDAAGSPACAGMSLCPSLGAPCLARFPRLRGDVPRSRWATARSAAVPPLARGCPPLCQRSELPHDGSPACAGMSLALIPLLTPFPRFPRLRGDVPMKCAVMYDCTLVPPLARGCPRKPTCPAPRQPGSPACAGMSPPRGARF